MIKQINNNYKQHTRYHDNIRKDESSHRFRTI